MPPPDGNRLVPVDASGLKVMSMGFLVPAGEAVVWRGPMLHKAIQQFLGGTAWGELDYLIVDMPPGTGDVALSLSQSVPLTGAIVVCTPQDVALLDAVKAIAMFRKVNIPVLGMVENMSYFVCPGCSKRYDIFVPEVRSELLKNSGSRSWVKFRSTSESEFTATRGAPQRTSITSKARRTWKAFAIGWSRIWPKSTARARRFPRSRSFRIIRVTPTRDRRNMKRA